MKKMVVKVVVLVLVLAAVSSIGFIFGKADAKSTAINLRFSKNVFREDDPYAHYMMYEFIDTDTGVHYFTDCSGEANWDGSSKGTATFMCPRYDKKGNVMVTKVK